MPHKEVKWIESLFEDIIPDNFPNLMKVIKPQIKEYELLARQIQIKLSIEIL